MLSFLLINQEKVFLRILLVPFFMFFFSACCIRNELYTIIRLLFSRLQVACYIHHPKVHKRTALFATVRIFMLFGTLVAIPFSLSFAVALTAFQI